jgi:hypothetical protein
MVRLGQAPHHYGAQFRHHIGLALLAKATLGFAQAHLTPYASASYEHESNVFYEWGGAAAAGQPSAPLEADLLRTVRAGLDMEDSWSGQKLSFKG